MSEILQLSLYLKGDDLDPNEATLAFGITPTRSHLKGDVIDSPQGRLVRKSTGLWCFSVRSDKIDFPVLFSDFFSKISRAAEKMLSVRGVEERYIDILFIKGADGGGTIDFDLGTNEICSLAKLGIPVMFTISIARE